MLLTMVLAHNALSVRLEKYIPISGREKANIARTMNLSSDVSTFNIPRTTTSRIDSITPAKGLKKLTTTQTNINITAANTSISNPLSYTETGNYLYHWQKHCENAHQYKEAHENQHNRQ